MNSTHLNNIRLLFVCVVFSIFTFAINLNARDIYIAPNGDDEQGNGSADSPWQTITHTLEAYDGAENNILALHLASGTYSASQTSETFPIVLESYISLIGAGFEQTIIDGEGPESGTMHLFIADNIDNITLSGLTASHGGHQTVNDPLLLYAGGGIFIRNSSNIRIIDASFVENRSVEGGALYCIDSEHLIVQNSSFLRNRANYHRIIGGNESPLGAGLLIKSTSFIRISNTAIEENIIDDRNGALMGCGIVVWDCRNFQMRESSISRNIGNGCIDAGFSAVGMDIDNSDSILICDNIFSENISAHDGGRGIALCVNGHQVLIRDNTFIDNYAFSPPFEECSGTSVYLLPGTGAFYRNNICQQHSEFDFAVDLCGCFLTDSLCNFIFVNNNIIGNTGKGLVITGWSCGQFDNPLPLVNIGGAEGWGNNVFNNHQPQMQGEGPLFGTYKNNATWNFWGDGADPVNDRSVIWPHPSWAFFVEPFASQEIEPPEVECYIGFNQGFYFLEEVGDTAHCAVILSNLSKDSSELFLVNGHFESSTFFTLDTINERLDFLKTTNVQFSFIPDNLGEYFDTIRVTIRDRRDELSFVTLPIKGICGRLSVTGDINSPLTNQQTFCYPNPFNSQTTINYSLQFPQFVTLNVYNILGQEIFKGHIGYQLSGSQRFIFSGNNYPSGVYNYIIKAKPFDLNGTLHICR